MTMWRMSVLTGMAMAIATVSLGEELGVVELTERRLKTPDGREYMADMGTFTVPENRANPDSNVIKLGIMRVKSTSDNPGPPIFILAGGPGGSSIENLRNYLNASEKLLALGDLVGVDQRGVSKSRPNLNRFFFRVLPFDEPTDREKVLAAYCEVIEDSKAYWKEKGVDLRGYTTEESADDINAVREALGYESMRLFGRSYGSHLGLSIMRRHGDDVASAVFQGIEGPDHTFKTPSQIQTGLEKVAALVAADPALNEKIPDFIALVSRVLEKLDTEPREVEVDLGKTQGMKTVTVSKTDVQYWTANNIGRNSSMVGVPAAYYAMDHGDFDELARFVVQTRRITIQSAMAPITDCASGMTQARRKRITREAGETTLGDVVNGPYPDICDCWEAPDLGDEFRGALKSDVPVLLICGDLDSRTPESNARELMPGLSNSRLIIVKNAGHDPRLFTSKESVNAAANFFRDGTVEAETIEFPRPELKPLVSY